MTHPLNIFLKCSLFTKKFGLFYIFIIYLQIKRLLIVRWDTNALLRTSCIQNILDSEKYFYYHRQVEVLHDAYIGTHELMDNGKASYIEVLTAQENLLSSQLNEASNMYKGAQAVIALYIALGGGTK